ncbi:MAG: DinB family protein [Planctomycetia bacterium]|nr:DinB family protein [Planctomycetia bacterium]
MSLLVCVKEIWEFSRSRTLATLDEIAKQPDPHAVLGWRPGLGRAHIAWQLLHIGVTEELFATERIFGKPAAFSDLIPRFKGGSVPDENIPALNEIRDALNVTRQHLLDGISQLTDTDLIRIPDAFKERGWTIAKALSVLTWHEAHHQGQAHITLNLWKNRAV